MLNAPLKTKDALPLDTNAADANALLATPAAHIKISQDPAIAFDL